MKTEEYKNMQYEEFVQEMHARTQEALKKVYEVREL